MGVAIEFDRSDRAPDNRLRLIIRTRKVAAEACFGGAW
jgi:hypothetical protein